MLFRSMATWQTIDQVPAEFIPKKKPRINKKTGEVIVEKENFLDKMYKAIFARKEKVTSAPPSSNAIAIPEEFLTEEVRAAMGTVLQAGKTETVTEITEEPIAETAEPTGEQIKENIENKGDEE